MNQTNPQSTLIYHSANDEKKQKSPFDIAIRNLVTGKKIKIACPYITLNSFKDIISLSEGWLLIADIYAWVDSLKDYSDKKNVQKFINDNFKNIKHFNKLHAKTIITDQAIFLGSANFTDSGILSNNELSIAIDDKEKAIELNNWFDGWWAKCGHIDIDLLEEHIQYNRKIQHSIEEANAKGKEKKPRKQKSPVIKTTSGFSENKKDSNHNQTQELIDTTSKHNNQYNEFVTYIKAHDNFEWEKGFLKLVGRAIKIIDNYENGSKYLLLRQNNPRGLIRLIMHNRYMIYQSDIENKIVGLVLPLEFKEIRHKYEDIIHNMRKGFTKDNVSDLAFVRFRIEDFNQFPQEILTMWEDAIKQEKNNPQRQHSYKSKHNHMLYDLCRDDAKIDSFFEKLIQERVDKKLNNNLENNIEKYNNQHNEFVTYIKAHDNFEWEKGFLKLVGRAIKIIGTEEISQYILLNQTYPKKDKISLMLNHRALIYREVISHHKIIALILPLEFKKIKHKYENIINEVDEDFIRQKVSELAFVKFIIEDFNQFPPEILTMWENAIRQEKNNPPRLNPHPENHNYMLYDLCRDDAKIDSFFEKLNQKQVNKKLDNNLENNIERHNNQRNEFVTYIKKHDNFEWDKGFLKLLGKAIKILGTEEVSEYILLGQTYKRGEISLMLNHRVLIYQTNLNKKIIGLMLPLEFKEIRYKYEDIIDRMNEGFTRNNIPDLAFVYFRIQNISELSQEILTMWENAIRQEKNNPPRLNHKPENHNYMLYDLCNDDAKIDSFFEELTSQSIY